MRETKNKKAYFAINIVIMCVMTLILVVGTVFFIKSIRRESRNETQYTLRVVATETANLITNELQSKIDYLNSLWLEILSDGLDNLEGTIKAQAARAEIYNFERVGFAYHTGEAITSDGDIFQIQDEALFQRNMLGEISIDKRSLETDEGVYEEMIILAIPVYMSKQTTTPIGMLYQVFSLDTFRTLLATQAFDGQVSTCLMNYDGIVIVASENLTYTDGENVLHSMLRFSDKNRDFVEQMTENMHNKRGGQGEFVGTREPRACYYTPVYLRGVGDNSPWYLAIILPKQVLEAYSTTIISSSMYLSVFVIGFVAMLFIQLVLMLRRQNKDMESVAYRDLLTEGENYEWFKHKFNALRNRGGVMIVCDIAEFKLINRYFGSQKGDETLRKIGQLFAKTVQGNNLVARISDDQFVFYFSAMKMEEAAVTCMQLYESVLEMLHALGIHQSFPVFGYCRVDGDEDIERYRSRATFAKKQAKTSGTIYCAYDSKAAEALNESAMLLSEFDSALSESGFEVWYQPKYGLNDRRVCGAEALVRWRGKDGKLISPARFIPLLEERDKIYEMDEYVFTQVCRNQRRWMSEGLPIVPVSVNLSRGSLVRPGIELRFRRILEEIGANQSYIWIEITEDSVQENVIGVIQALRREGFRVLMDDFGRGSSNLAGVRRDLFDGIKFDKTLIDLIGQEEEVVLQHTMHMVQSMRMSITAEGVETGRQSDFLSSVGCDEVQGFYYYRPMPADRFEQLLRVMAIEGDTASFQDEDGKG